MDISPLNMLNNSGNSSIDVLLINRPNLVILFSSGNKSPFSSRSLVIDLNL